MTTFQNISMDELRGKRIFVLIDPDIERGVPTIRALLDKPVRLILGTHLGSAAGNLVETRRLNEFATELSHIIGRPVRKLDEAIGPEVTRAVMEMKEGDIVVLENLNFYPGELRNDADFARQLASLCDVYIDDAFEVAHRALASNVGITRWVPISAAGLFLSRQLEELHDFCARPAPPFAAVIGGGRLQEKLPILRRLLPKLDRLFIGGRLAPSFLKSMGVETGKAPIEPGFSRLIDDFLQDAKRQTDVRLPEDFMIRDGETMRCALDTQIRPSDEPVDIGVHSLAQIKHVLDGAHTILWIDGLGLDDTRPFNTSDYEVAQWMKGQIAPRWQRVLLAGDSLLASLSYSGVVKEFENVAMFGDAASHVIAGWALPAVEALRGKTAASNNSQPKRVLLPVDGSEPSLSVARHLAEHLGRENAEISLLYVHSSEGSLGRDVWRDPSEVERVHAEAQMAAQPIFTAVDCELARHGLTSHHHVVREGDPAEQILKYADEIQADLIAMGMHGRTGALRFMLGSVSQKVLDNAKCPILIARITDRQLEEVGMLTA